MKNKMISPSKKWVASLALIATFPVVSASYSNDLPGYLISQKQVGLISYPSETASQLMASQNWGWQSVYADTDLSEVNLVIINLAEYTNSDAVNIAKQAFRKEKILILDSSQAANSDQVAEITSQIIGIGLTDPIVIVRKNKNSPEYKSLSVSAELTEEEIQTRLIEETKAIIKEWDTRGLHSSSSSKSSRVRRSAASYSSRSSSSTPYRPEVTIPLEFRHIGFKCRVGKEFDGNGWSNSANWNGTIEDACNGEASVSLFYNLDFIRSVPFNGGGDQNADNAKYVRVTLNPGGGETGGSASGGAGWHLVDKPSHKHTWFESWTNRLTWFGPIAMDYAVEITTNDSDVHLFNTIPNNKPKESEIREVSGFTVGVEAGGKAEVGEKGPTVGVEAKGSFSYNSQRWVTYKAHEYTVENHSRAGAQDRAKWLWDRKFSEDSKNWRTNDTCALWCSDWFFKDTAFSAASYANYKPGFSATFQAPSNKSGESTFTISNKVTVAALGGRVQYMIWYQGYTPWSYNGTTYTFNKNFRVNWDAPVFEPEVNVSIEAFRKDSPQGICLDVEGNSIAEGASVIGYSCQYSNNQLWGLDNYQRYRSRVAKNRCLTAESDNAVTVRNCTSAANQKWRWEGDYLVNELGKYLGIVNGEVKMTNNADDYRDWRNYVRNIEADKILTVLN
ncbi:ricin-type beta-trefoil lectin domain protein [Endozoicomonas sp. SM1973]|uniref:Ricin-type beta-trefoil lectin domain protein n=1 Tax=Spartinivicinus marinus TaxID=2994442 RepID=A0A853IB92_9GAMM|nr:leukocidin family pore-forming toxin [Spartinivicinus marinus]MCX4026261.1 leukocidin family pore-forming toxin [Spartinivicinus marinus]NYZ67324.1 ricin-type beta-trefoil lectin domain protein [Spartinivicinus marinus]